MPDSERYERQIIMDGWGDAGQRKLAAAHVGIVGTGGLGSPVALYLAAAGVGTLTLCDNQEIELSNLNRQILYGTPDVGGRKVEVAARRLSDLNPDVDVRARHVRVTDDTVDDVLGDCTLIVDCLDNFETRFVINRFCVRRRLPMVHAGVREFYGQTMLINPPHTPCLACFLPSTDAGDGPIPICGATAGVFGSMQASMALQWLIGLGRDTAGIFINVDLVDMQIHKVNMKKRVDCPVCGDQCGR